MSLPEHHAALFALIKQKMASAGWIELPALGCSMFPLIREGNKCCFHAIPPQAIQKGDILLYKSASGGLIAHRFCSVEEENRKRMYLCKGDTNLGYDQLIAEDQILGILYSIQTDTHHLHMTDLRVVLWRKAITGMPILSRLINRYLARKNTRSVKGASA
jgi:signal peptidase